MVSLSNQARLLAAQAFNKKVLEDKARAKQAEIEAERQKDLRRTTKRLEEAKASARNAVERQRIQDSINKQLASKAEAERRAKINAEAKRQSAQVFTKVAKGSNIGILTGFEAKKDTKGRTVGISTRESATRKNTKKLLLAEIARQKKIAREGTDLERFLSNEQAINRGQVSSAELKRQIAQRKARGLSKTPAQKRASQFFADQEFSSALDARAKRKGGDGRATFGTVLSERARASGLGSKPFIDPLFAFGGRTKSAQVGRGGTFGRRAGGESISSQLSFISSIKAKSTSGRINFAQGLLSNLNFSGSSQQGLLSIIGQKKLNTPKTFEQELRSGVGFFTTVQAPVTKAKITKGQRARLVSARKAEDFAKANDARELIRATKAQTKAKGKANIDDLAIIARGLPISNFLRGREIERQNALAPPRFSGGFTLSPFDVSVQRVQAVDPTQLALVEQREFVGTPAQIRQAKNSALKKAGLTPSQIRQVNQGTAISNISGKLTPKEKRAIATQKSNETKALRESGGGGFFGAGGSFGRDDLEGVSSISGLVTATGIAGTTTTTTPKPTERSVPLDESLAFSGGLSSQQSSGNIFDINLSENIGFSDTVSSKKKKGTKTSKPKPTTTQTRQTQSPQTQSSNIFDISSIISGGAGRVASDIGGIGSGVRGGISNFFSIPSQLRTGARVGDVSQSQLDREILRNLGF